jgi:hypothetical protein
MITTRWPSSETMPDPPRSRCGRTIARRRAPDNARQPCPPKTHALTGAPGSPTIPPQISQGEGRRCGWRRSGRWRWRGCS